MNSQHQVREEPNGEFRWSRPPQVTVIVPAHAAGKTLPACLNYLRNASLFEPIDVVVVHDNENLQGIEERRKGFHVSELKSCERDNAGAARNCGAAQVNSGIIVFVDSDVLIEEQSIALLIRPILDGVADATVGNYSDDVRGLSFAQAYKQLYVHTAYGRRRGTIRNEFWTALGAIRAEVFHTLGGFDGRFGGACGEDTDLGQRLTRAGYRILAAPEARARHLHQFTCAGLVRNDLTKGTQIMLNNLRNKNRFEDNRHTSKADIAAVALSLAFLFSALGGSFYRTVWAAMPPTLFGWMIARRELLSAFRRQRMWFLMKAIPLTLLLDWVRAICVALGVIKFKLSIVTFQRTRYFVR